MLSDKSAIEKGTVLMEAEPFVYILSEKYQSTRCDYCLSNEGEMHKCTGCQYVYYCNRHCQKSAWKIHKSECKNMKRCQPLTLPDTARLIARIIIKLRDGQGSEKGYYLTDRYRTFNDLMSHSEEIKRNSKKMEHVFTLKYVLDDFFGEETQVPDVEELLGIYGRVNTNAFHISHNIENIAVGIYLGPSVLDHSCSPNAIVTFQGTKLIVRSLEDLPECDYSKIRISYIDLLQSNDSRKKELEDTYNFTCNCEKCQKPDLRSNAMACPNSTCKNYCNFEEENCSECGEKLTSKLKSRFLEVVQFTDSKMSEMKETNNMELVEECLKIQKGILHDLSVRRIKTLATGMEVAINSSLWEKALAMSPKLISGYLEYYTKYNNVTIDLYLTTAKLLLYLEKYHEANKTLKEIEPVLKITHGDEHPYTKTLNSMLMDCNFAKFGMKSYIEEIENSPSNAF